MSQQPAKIPGAFCSPAPRIIFFDVDKKSFPAYPQKKWPGSGKLQCNFCKKNGETVANYSSHQLRNENGIIECPILRSHVCKFCQETGDNAHTLSYCPSIDWLKPVIRELGANDALVNMGDLRMTHFSAAGQRVNTLNNHMAMKECKQDIKCL